VFIRGFKFVPPPLSLAVFVFVFLLARGEILRMKGRAMKTLIKILQLSAVPVSANLALFVLRLTLGLSMLLLHGWDKVAKFSEMSGSFPDSFGIGADNVLFLAIFSEVFCSVLLVAGLFTRLAALAGALAMATAFFLVGQAQFSANGELAFLYLAGYAALVFAGAGGFSLDAWTRRLLEKKTAAERSGGSEVDSQR
jgi:putative oxidoreductase